MAIDKNRPTTEWIASLQGRFPCEPEVDRFLTAKLQERPKPPYQPVSLNELCRGLERLLRASFPHADDDANFMFPVHTYETGCRE